MLKLVISLFTVSVVLTLAVLGVQVYQGANMSQEAFALSQEVQSKKLDVELQTLKLKQQAAVMRYNKDVRSYNRLTRLDDSSLGAVVQSVRYTAYEWWFFFPVSALFGAGLLYAYTAKQTTIREVEKARSSAIIAQQASALEVVKAVAPHVARSMGQALVAGLKQQHALLAPQAALPAAPVLALPVNVPSFRELLDRGEIAEGKPLTMGFAPDGQPQHRTLEDIKALTVAGWQGSGKTLSTAYLVSCLLLQYQNSRGWVIDPHQNHEKGLGNYLAPYAASGRLTIVNPFEIRNVVDFLNTRLDNRLNGVEPSDPLLFLVIDELSRLGKSDVFKEHLKPFLDRCTEEIRKANILFIGGGQKWQARYFNGDASFRQSVPSMLMHKIKPSQAALLFEDAEEKKLVKQLAQPGSALLATSHDTDPCITQMPLITRQDIYMVSQRLVSNGGAVQIHEEASTPVDTADTQDTRVLSDEIIREKIQALYNEDTGNSWGKLGEEIGVERSFLRKCVKGEREFSAELREKCQAFLATTRTNVIAGPWATSER